MSSSIDPRAIRFGTSGWRGVFGAEVDFERLTALVRAVAYWIGRRGAGKRVVVAFDGRFASAHMAEVTASELAAAGFTPLLSDRPIPTPTAVHAIRKPRVAAALVLTASHNPAEYHGLKVFGPGGVGVDDRSARVIERRASRELVRIRNAAPVRFERGRGVAMPSVDLTASYRTNLLRTLGGPLPSRSRPLVVLDAMHGVGAAVAPQLLASLGARVRGLRLELDAGFGGTMPDPAGARLARLASEVKRSRGARFGVALDGDADRFGVVDGSGRPLRDGQVAALLVDELASAGEVVQGVALTLASGSLVERVALGHGLAVRRHPIGFKFLGAALAAGAADVASDESGGFAWSRFGCDKDGIAAAALLTRAAARDRSSLRARVTALEREHGRLRSGRSELPADPALLAGLEQLIAAAPERVAGARVRDVICADGLHLRFDDGFVMWRRSGTEAAVRVYAEAVGERAVEARLAAGIRVLRRAASVGPSQRIR